MRRGCCTRSTRSCPYCPRDQVTLSSHELGQPGAYRDVIDRSVFVRLPVSEAAAPLQDGDELVVWTTTPWTLVSNAAVAVSPELRYVRARTPDGRVQVVAKELVGRVLDERAEVLDEFAGSELIGTRYAPPFPYISSDAYGPKGHTVLAADFVTATDGSGLVHTAIAFGDDDFRLGEREGLTVVNPVRADGTYDERIGPYAGRKVKDCDADLIEDLRARGLVLRDRGLRALLPALLALRHRADLLRQAVLVHHHQRDQGPAAGRQRDDQLAPRTRQARALRQLAGEQRRLGALARALLGHAAAGVALRPRPLKVIGSLDELERAVRRRARRSPSPVRRRRRASPATTAAARCGACLR